MKIFGTTEELIQRLYVDKDLAPKVRRAIEEELAYRQRDSQWAQTREKAHRKWLKTGRAF